MEQQEFLKIEAALRKAAKVVNKNTGEVLKITPSHKLIYRYMLERYRFFSKAGNRYFDNQESISQECAISLATTQRLLYDLKDVGLIVVQTELLERSGSRKKNFYTVVDIFEHGFLLESLTREPKKQKTQQLKSVPINKVVEEKKNICLSEPEYEDWPDCPF